MNDTEVCDKSTTPSERDQELLDIYLDAHPHTPKELRDAALSARALGANLEQVIPIFEHDDSREFRRKSHEWIMRRRAAA
jgi:hypothetical protein